MSKIQTIRTRIDQLNGQRQQLEKFQGDLKETLRDNKRSLVRHEQAREVIREVGLATQQQ